MEKHCYSDKEIDDLFLTPKYLQKPRLIKELDMSDVEGDDVPSAAVPVVSGPMDINTAIQEVGEERGLAAEMGWGCMSGFGGIWIGILAPSVFLIFVMCRDMWEKELPPVMRMGFQ